MCMVRLKKNWEKYISLSYKDIEIFKNLGILLC